MRSIILLMFSVIALSFTANAQTYTQAGGGDDLAFQVYGDDQFGNPLLIPGLTATLSYVIAPSDGTTWVFTVTITNTSSLASNLTGFGFDLVSAGSILGDQVTVDDPGGTFVGVHVPGGFPNVLGDFVDLTDLDVCIDSDGGGACQGSGGGLAMGDSATLTLTIIMDQEVDDITLDDFGVRYQGFTFVDGNGFTIGSGVGMVTPIPEPATWLMMAIGFTLVGASARRSRRRANSIAQTC